MLNEVLSRVCQVITDDSLEGQKPLTYEIIPNHFGSTLSVVHPEPQFDEDGQGLLFSEAVPVTTKFKRLALPFITMGVNGLKYGTIRVKLTQRCPLNGKVYISGESLEPYEDLPEEECFHSLRALLELVVDESPPATEDPSDLEAWNIMRILQGKNPFQ